MTDQNLDARQRLEALRKPERLAWEATAAEYYESRAWNAALDAALAALPAEPPACAWHQED